MVHSAGRLGHGSAEGVRDSSCGPCEALHGRAAVGGWRRGMNRSELDALLADLRVGKLREIAPKLRRLNPADARAVAAKLCAVLEEVVERGAPDATHRWVVTALQFLAPPDAGDLVAKALRKSVHLTHCCGCVRNRLIQYSRW